MEDPQAQLDQAQALFEDGRIIESAEVLHAITLEADETGDGELRADIRDLVGQMRGHLTGTPDLADFNTVFRHGRAAPSGELPLGRKAQWSPEERSARRRLVWARLVLVLGALGLGLGGLRLASSSSCANSSNTGPNSLAFVGGVMVVLSALPIGAAVLVHQGKRSWERWAAALGVTVVLGFVLLWIGAFAALCPD